MPTRLLRSTLVTLVAVAVAACGGDGGGPTPPADPLVEQVDALFPAGAARDKARTLAGEVTTAAAAGETATAEGRALDLAELTMTEFYAGRLAPAEAQQPGAIDAFLTDAFVTAGLGDPGLEPASFSDEGLVALVRAAGGTFVTATRRAGITIPAGAAPRAALLTLRRLPDSSAFAPRRGPLPTALDQYPLFYDFSFTPDIELTADAILGLCQVADPASAYYPADAVFARLQLAHPDPADRTRIALLERADAPFLDCDGTTGSVRQGADELARVLLRRVGIGGRVRKFSPFAAVEPPAQPPGTAALTVSRAGTGTGTVTSSPAGITCGADCSEPYTVGTQVTLTAAASGGSTFAGWSGGGCSGTGPCVVTVNAATTVTATFGAAAATATLTVTRAGTGTGTVTSTPAGITCGTDCTEDYAVGTQVTLAVTSPAGNGFGGWSGGGCSGTAGTCVVTVNAATTVTATFNVNQNVAFERLTTGQGFSCGLSAQAAYCWGTNSSGSLGSGSLAPQVINRPRLIAGGLRFTELVGGPQFTCGVQANTFRLYCWGRNRSGAIGDGTTNDAGSPALAAGGQVFARGASAGLEHMCAINAAGGAFCWGANARGQLGDGSRTDRLTPVAVAGGHVFRQLAATEVTTCGLRNDGAILCWGDNLNGQLGNGSATDVSTTPVVVSGGRTYTSLGSSMARTICAIATDGGLWCWGANNAGQIGDGTLTERRTPVQVEAGRAFSNVSVGGVHTCALATTSFAFCWGGNVGGQLGDGTTDTRVSPVRVADGRFTFTAVFAGWDHTCALSGVSVGSRAYCWGTDTQSQLGTGEPPLSRSLPTLVVQP